MTVANEPLLEVLGYSGGFTGARDGFVPVLADVGFSIPCGSSTAIVGESGSGKSLTALSILGLTPSGFRRTAGEIRFGGRDLLGLDAKTMRSIRGSAISLVFQDARAALNPVLTVGRQIADVCRTHQGISYREARKRAQDMLDLVRVPEPARRMSQYPHEFSGGMAQRAMLAMALVCQPTLLILDEPTTGLDVTIQADILDLIEALKVETGMTTCLITHDLGIVAERCDRVVVMKQGEVCETGTCEQIMTKPSAPYTQRLIADSRLVA